MTSGYWDSRYEGTELVWGGEPNKFLVAETAGLPPGRALDLACGEGRNTLWLAREGWDATGVDFSHVAIERARAIADTAGVTVEFVEADLLDYEPELRAYDLVVLAYLHLPPTQRRLVLSKAAGGVAPGGRLFIVAHDITNLDEGYGGPQDAEILPSPEELAGEVGELEVIKAERVAREVETPDGPRTAIDALVVASQPTP